MWNAALFAVALLSGHPLSGASAGVEVAPAIGEQHVAVLGQPQRQFRENSVSRA